VTAPPGLAAQDVAGVAAARSRGATLVSVVAALATAIAILGASVALFFNPVWVGFEQGRTQVDAWTGWDAATIRSVTDSVVIEVFAGPGTFAQQANGAPVFSAEEAGHMADVRRLVIAFGTVVAVAVVALVAAWWPRRRREAFWRGVRAGALGLVVVLIAAGTFAVVLFDTAFEIFHRLFFAAGTYSFDPATSRLVQLFPEAFWMETSIALGVVAIAASAVVVVIAGRRRRAAAGAAGSIP
jgi:integral membrane protein (TIGR01906 family)